MKQNVLKNLWRLVAVLFVALLMPATALAQDEITEIGFSIWFDQPGYTFTLGESFTSPVVNTDPQVTGIIYSTNNPDVVSVDKSTGALTLLQAGRAMIFAKFSGDERIEGEYEASYALQVNAPTVVGKRDPELSINGGTTPFDPNKGFLGTLGEAFSPPSISNPYGVSPIVWTSSNESVATVDDSGNITLLAVGWTQIKAYFAGNDEFEEGMAEYSLVVSEPEPEPEAPIETPTTVNPSTTAIPGATVTTSGVSISLDEDDIVDKEEGSVTITKTSTTDQVKELMETAKPGSSDFADKFKGVYAFLSAGKGYVEMKCELLGDYEVTVMQGDKLIGTYTSTTEGMIKISYDSDTDEWVMIFPTIAAAARAKMPLENQQGGLKIYSVKIVPEKVVKKGDANGDQVVDTADIVEVVNSIMGKQSNNFWQKGGDANGNGTVDAADIVSIVNMIIEY